MISQCQSNQHSGCIEWLTPVSGKGVEKEREGMGRRREELLGCEEKILSLETKA